MATIKQLLNSSSVGDTYTQTSLAALLGCSRGTLRKYMKDIKGEQHYVRHFEGKMQLMTLIARVGSVTNGPNKLICTSGSSISPVMK